jgi:hypothetical protein
MLWMIMVLITGIITVGGLYVVIRWMIKVNKKLDMIMDALDIDQKRIPSE